jgi:hypothetical protein
VLIKEGALLPITARLSRKFYERFGDEIASEFVDWFNAVDSAYQQQLRELNDLNWERFKATMDARFSASEGRFTEKLAATKSNLMRWMFIYWSGTVLTIGGLLVALTRH